MADSPLAAAEGVVRVTVLSEGEVLPDTVQIISVTVTRAINRVPTARLILVDADMPGKTFALSDTDHFKPGCAIQINAGYGHFEEAIFEGIVIKHAIQLSGGNIARLVVECHDKAVKLTVGRKNANYIGKTDSDIIDALIKAYPLRVDVEPTAVRHRELVQYDCTDWDFMLSRAEANGLLVIATDGKISVKPPDTDSEATLKVRYGVDLMEFTAELDARTQYASTRAASWDAKTQSLIFGAEAGPAELNRQGDLTSAMLAEAVGLDSYRLQTVASRGQEELTQWAKAVQLKSALARIRGRMRFQGSVKAVVGGVIELAGVGRRFDGNVFVSALTHEIGDGNWTTEAAFGLEPQWHTERDGVTAPRAAGLLPAVEGLQIGVITKLEGDPDGEHRVQVSVPELQAQSEGVWARLLQFHGSSGFGAFFVPEVGDEVVLGYFNHDPSHPVILGSLYSSMHAPAYALNALNNTKAIVTRCRSKIEFDEEGKSITVTTPGSNRLVVSDAGKSVSLHDQNDNKVELNASGITLASSTDIRLVARGKITLDADGSISISSRGDVTTAGLNINCEAQVGLTAKGAASAELSAAGQTVVKGAMVMIN